MRMRKRGMARLAAALALVLCAFLPSLRAEAAGGCSLALRVPDAGGAYDGAVLALYRIGERTDAGWALASPEFDDIAPADEYKAEDMARIEAIVDASGWPVAAQAALTNDAAVFGGLEPGYYFVRKRAAADESESVHAFTPLSFVVKLETAVEVDLKYTLTTESAVEKRWTDDAAEGNRPESVTVRLMRRVGDGLEPAVEEALNPQTGRLERRAVVRTLTEAGGWRDGAAGLPKYDEGALIEYVWQEDAVARYALESSETTADERWHSFATVLVNAPETTRRVLFKRWRDAGDQDGVRPGAIRAQLCADGEPWGDPVTLTAADALPDDADTWRFEWTGLPAWREGAAVAYTVEELDVEALEALGYTSRRTDAGQGIYFTIDNTHVPETTKVAVSKVWDDENDYDGLRPGEIRVTLLENGAPWSAGGNEPSQANPAVLRPEDHWAHTWIGLDRFADGGEEIVYTVQETPVEGYESRTERTANGWIVTNVRTPKRGDLKIVKRVTANGRETAGRVADGTYVFTVTGPLGSSREADFTLPVAIVDGRSAAVERKGLLHGQYAIREADAHNGAALAAVTVNGAAAEPDAVIVTVGEDAAVAEAVFTNDIKVTSVSVAKVWAGETDAASRPAAVTVRLLEGGRAIDTRSLNAANDWRTTWTELPKYEGDGSTLKVYAVDEVDARGYVSSGPRPTSGAADANYAITNTFITPPPTEAPTRTASPGSPTPTPEPTSTPEPTPAPEPTVSVDGRKVWRDDGNAHGLRPGRITVELLADDVVVSADPVWRDRSGDTWYFSFTGLPALDADGEPIRYALREQPVENYSVRVEGNDIINTLISRAPSAYGDIRGVKTWDDGNDASGGRPNYVTLRLLRDGADTGERRTVTAADDWQYTFQNQPLDDGYGHAWTYTVREEAVPGYFAQVRGSDVTNVRLPARAQTNALPPDENVEELEALIELFDYNTPLFGELLQTGDERPVYPFVFAGVGALALLLLILSRRRRYDD